MPGDETPAPMLDTLTFRAIEQSKLEVRSGKQDLGRLRAEIQDLQDQIAGSRKRIAETWTFLKRFEERLPR